MPEKRVPRRQFLRSLGSFGGRLPNSPVSEALASPVETETIGRRSAIGEIFKWGSIAAIGGNLLSLFPRRAARINRFVKVFSDQEKVGIFLQQNVRQPDVWAGINEAFGNKINPLQRTDLHVVESINNFSRDSGVSPVRVLITIQLNQSQIADALKKGVLPKKFASPKSKSDRISLIVGETVRLHASKPFVFARLFNLLEERDVLSNLFLLEQALAKAKK